MSRKLSSKQFHNSLLEQFLEFIYSSSPQMQNKNVTTLKKFRFSAYFHQQTGTLIPVGSGTVGLIIVLYTYKLLRLSVKKLYKVYDS